MTDAIRTPDEILGDLPDFPFSSSYRQYDGLRLAISTRVMVHRSSSSTVSRRGRSCGGT